MSRRDLIVGFTIVLVGFVLAEIQRGNDWTYGQIFWLAAPAAALVVYLGYHFDWSRFRRARASKRRSAA